MQEQLRLCKFKNDAEAHVAPGYGYLHTMTNGSARAIFGVDVWDRATAQREMQDEAKNVDVQVGEPCDLDWRPSTRIPGQAVYFQDFKAGEVPIVLATPHVPAITPSDVRRGDQPPKLEPKPLPPV